MKLGISGAGRIGRMCIRKWFGTAGASTDLVAVNATCDAATLAHLLKYDSVHGTWDAEVRAEGNRLRINGKPVALLSDRDPARLPWKELGVELVIDATGRFGGKAAARLHLAAGARKTVLTYPAEGADATIVLGANDETYDPARHDVVSAASCTTNCLAVVLRVLDDAFGVEEVWMTAVHAYTGDQRHLDNPHADLRRARACAGSIVPTTTGVSRALKDVLPHLAPRAGGISVRVPTPDVSLVDAVVTLRRPVTGEEARDAFRRAAEGPAGAYLGYNELPLVSADYIGNEKSATVDGLSLMARGERLKILAWYDNEWAYACRVIELAERIARGEAFMGREPHGGKTDAGRRGTAAGAAAGNPGRSGGRGRAGCA